MPGRFAVILFSLLLNAAATAQPFSRLTLGLEILGAAPQGSIQLDFRPYSFLSTGTGFSTVSIGDKGHYTAVPIHLAVLIGDTHFWQTGTGVTIIRSSGIADTAGVAALIRSDTEIPFVETGYRYQPAEGGFFFRASGYLFFPRRDCPDCGRYNSFFWGGITLGYSFWRF